MFGASEDRARQLAGRQRWKRIASTGSTRSYRSASSSSQLSQLSHLETSSIFEQSTKRPISIPEHYASTIYSSRVDQLGHGRSQSLAQYKAAADVEKALAHMMANSNNPRIQQQRSQAKYMSQVLYNDAAVKEALLSSSSCSVLPSLPKKYGMLGWGARLLDQQRHATEPVTHASTQDRQQTMATTLETANRSISVGISSLQPTVSLRGDADNFIEHSWFWSKASRHPYLALPFNTGPKYRGLVDRLCPSERASFADLLSDSTDLGPKSNAARRMYYRNDLDDAEKLLFWEAAVERATSLLDGGSVEDLDAAQSLADLQRAGHASVDGSAYPLVDLQRLLIALSREDIPIEDTKLTG